MKKFKRGLALLLVLMMLVTTLPATAVAADEADGSAAFAGVDGEVPEADDGDGVSLLGMAYIPTVTCTAVDLRWGQYLLEDLKAVPLEKLLPGVNLSNVSAIAYLDHDSNGSNASRYQVLQVTDAATIDLSGLMYPDFGSPYYNIPMPLDCDPRIEIINSDDQLDTSESTVRYIIPVYLSNPAALLSFEAYDENGTPIASGDDWAGENNWNGYSYSAYSDLPRWSVRKAKVSMNLNPSMGLSGLTATVYAANGVEITDQIWDKGREGYNTDWTSGVEGDAPSFTVELRHTDTGAVAQVLNLTLSIGCEWPKFVFDASTVATETEAAEPFAVALSKQQTTQNSRTIYYDMLRPENFYTWQSGEATLKLRYKTAGDTSYDDYNIDDYSDYTAQTDVTVYTGYYETVQELNTAIAYGLAKDVTDKIWGSEATGYTADFTDGDVNTMPKFTLIVKENGSDVVSDIEAFGVYMTPQTVSPVEVCPAEALSTQSGYQPGNNTSDWRKASTKREQDPKTGTYYYTMRYLSIDEIAEGHSEYATDGTYYLRFDATGGTEGESKEETRAKISKIVYGTDEGGADISARLWAGTYPISFSTQPVVFTVFFTDPTVPSQEIRLRTVAAKPLTDYQKEPSKDTYFNVSGVKGYDTYVMSSDVDSSYQTGFQVIYVYGAKDGDLITPTYSTGSGVKMFEKHNEMGVRLPSTGEMDPIVLETGVPQMFSAASESGTHLRNYWVTFIAQQSGPKLWINGEKDADHWDMASGMARREVFIYDRGGYHDILFSNIGDTPLTNLEVTLTSRNNNIRLDDYWTIKNDGARTLAPFTTITSADRYSELDNMAKIRIWADGAGDVDGVLTIKADGQQISQIRLSGKVGQAAIVSSKVPDGVKFVPYSCLIQTNFASRTGNDADRPTFSLVGGTLPANVSLNPNTGEIYGVPRSYGTFTFAVAISQNGRRVDTKQFTMTIVDNEDEDVWNASDETYAVLDWIGEQYDVNTGNTSDGKHHYVIDLKEISEEIDCTFVSEGPYLYYRKVFLDSKLLVEGVDYRSEEGSTKLVLDEGTLTGDGNNTNGRHTLAIEFRESDDKQGLEDKGYEGTLKRTSQNYYIEGGIDAPQGGGNGGGGGQDNKKPDTSGSGKKPITTPPKTDLTPVDDGFPFVDVRTNNWFYNDVYWTWDNKIMNGVSSDRFAPSDPISQAMIVVVLARLVDVDLTQFANVQVDGAAPGMWYTEAAAWAQQSGILPDDSSFSSEGALSRDGMAIMLVKYMASMGIDTNAGSNITFADTDQMTDAGRNAFQVLYQYGIFNGVGNGKMDPVGTTTRAQFAALVHRVSNFVASR